MPLPKLDFKTTGYGPLVQVIYDSLAEDILRLRRLDATEIDMDAVAEEHGATTMNVHRAFETLRANRLIHYDQESGIAKVHFGAHDVIDLTETRLTLELTSLRIASCMPDKSDWHSVAQWPHKCGVERELNLRYSQYVRFHCSLFGPMNNDVRTRQFVWLMDDFQKYFYHLWRDTAVFDEHMQDAENTLRLLLDGDEEEAFEAHASHLQRTRDMVLANLQKQDRATGTLVSSNA